MMNGNIGNRAARQRTSPVRAPPDLHRERGAASPEELETLFEDALLLHDRAALAGLFEDRAVLSTDDAHPARGREEIARLALAIWDGDHSYVADPRHVMQARDIALIIGVRGVSVARRGLEGAWRYAIVVQSVDHAMDKGNTMTQIKQQPSALEPMYVSADAGQARWWFDSLAVVKATAADTGGLLSIVEVTEPPGSEAPLHVHHHEDEGFWILDGNVTFEVGDTAIEAHAGDYVFGPRGIPHRYMVGPAGCRMLFLVTPGGFEELIIAMSAPAASRTLPPPSDEEPDWEQVAAIAKAHGNELLA